MQPHGGDWWVTVMGDVPPATLQAVRTRRLNGGAEPHATGTVRSTSDFPRSLHAFQRPLTFDADVRAARRLLLVGAGAADGRCGALARRWLRAQALPDFTELVEQVGPAVVNIRTARARPRRRAGGGGAEIDETCEEFFRRFGIPMPEPARPAPRRRAAATRSRSSAASARASSSAPTAIVMTNAHVVDGADEVIVTLTDKREFKARIIGADKRTDVARGQDRGQRACPS